MNSLQQMNQLELNLESEEALVSKDYSSEEFIASRISQRPTGQIRLLESIRERKNMQPTQWELHFVRHAKDCVIFVRSERAGKRVKESIFHCSGSSSPGPDPA
jgi:hypothetical protein